MPALELKEIRSSQSFNNNNVEVEAANEKDVVEVFDYAKRAQWLRAAVLGANDGLLSTASLMMGVGAVRKDSKTMILTGIAGLVAGACSMAIGEFVSVYSQYDIELSQMKRGNKMKKLRFADDIHDDLESTMKKSLPNPWQAAGASALAFGIGALIPLIGAVFIKEYMVRLVVVMAVVSLALIGFGAFGAMLGGAPMLKSSLRVLLGGWLAMGITFGLTKLIIGRSGL